MSENSKEVIELNTSFEVMFPLKTTDIELGFSPQFPDFSANHTASYISELRETSKNFLSWFFIFNPFQRKEAFLFLCKANPFWSFYKLCSSTRESYSKLPPLSACLPFIWKIFSSIFLSCWSCCFRPPSLFNPPFSPESLRAVHLLIPSSELPLTESWPLSLPSPQTSLHHS